MENYKAKLPRYLKDNATTKKAEILKSIEDYKACIKTMEKMGAFLVAHNITDYNFKTFDFDFMGNTKKNIFLYFKY